MVVADAGYLKLYKFYHTSRSYYDLNRKSADLEGIYFASMYYQLAEH